MNLEEKVRKKVIVKNKLPDSALEKIEERRSAIRLDGPVDDGEIPDGYMQVQFPGEFGQDEVYLLKHSFCWYLTNEGEGDVDEALAETAEGYHDLKGIEDEDMDKGGTSIPESFLATKARENYKILLINKLVKSKWAGFARDGDFEPIAEFDSNALKSLDLNDPFVENRVKAMAALALGKKGEAVKAYDVGKLVKHVTVKVKKSEFERVLDKKQLNKMRCYMGSHWELSPEYRRDPDFKMKAGGRVYQRTARENVGVLDGQIEDLKKEILEYRMKKHEGKLGPDDEQLISTYANLKYIAPENPKSQFDIHPPKEYKKK